MRTFMVVISLLVGAPAWADVAWYAISLAGQPAGRASTLHRQEPDGTIETTQSSELRIGRLDQRVDMTTDAHQLEAADGRLREVHVVTHLSHQATSSDVLVGDRQADVRDAAGGPAVARTVSLKGPLLGPLGIERLSARTLRRVGDAVDYATWSVELGAPIDVHRRVEKSEIVRIGARDVSALLVLERSPVLVEPRRVWLDGSGSELRSSFALPFGEVEMLRQPTAPVLKETGADNPQLFRSALVPSNVRIPAARNLDQLRLRVTGVDPAVLEQLKSEQQTLVANEGLLIVDRAAKAPSPSPPPSTLLANAYIESTVPQIVAVAAEVGRGLDSRQRALALQSWVSEHMTFDAGVAFAPARELIAERRGTCAGYAVLLAALLRAAQIPSRIALGLVYVDGIFGGHAWVEAYLDGRWTPLDAALPSENRFADAARLAFAHDALEGGIGPLLQRGGAFFGHARLQIVGFTVHGQGPRALSGPPYEVHGDVYRNPGLGLTVVAPRGARITHVDGTWPDDTVVELTRGKANVVVRERSVLLGGEAIADEARTLGVAPSACRRATVAGVASCRITRGEKVELAFVASGSILVAGGDPQLVDEMAQAIRWDDARP